MSSAWTNAVYTYLWGDAAQETKFSGPAATVLCELERFSLEQQLIDRSETAHFDVSLHKKRVECLLRWHENIVVDKNHSVQQVCAQKLRIAKRIFEICEQERNWMFEMEPQIRTQVYALLERCATENDSDSEVLYYKNAL